MSSSNCIQISQEADQVVWYSHLFQNFPEFVVVHTIKDFGIVNKAEIDIFLEHSCYFDDSTDVGNLISDSSDFSKSSLNIWKFMVHVNHERELQLFCWSLAWRILSITLLACEMSAKVLHPKACALQQEKPAWWEARALQLENGPQSPWLEKSPGSNEDPAQPEINNKKNK